MSYFSSSLKITIEGRGWSQTEACKALALSTSTISLYLSGDRQPAPEQLKKILCALDESERAQILIAVMRDTIPSPEFRDLVVLCDATTSPRLREEAVESWKSIALPANVRKAFDILALEARINTALQDMLIAFAELTAQPTDRK